MIISEMVGSTPPEGTNAPRCACGEARPAKQHRRGHFYKRCTQCESHYRRQHPNRPTKQARDNARQRDSRRSKEHVDRWICVESRSSDRKHGRDNDMTREFIRELIRNGCNYCGDTSIRMTLDRIDNTVGHVKSNVVAACVRCNLVRRDMPFDAWLILASSMRTAREKGFFGNWMPAPRKALIRPTSQG